jgi:hypothetical protein
MYKSKLFCTFLDQFWLININTTEVQKLFDFDPMRLVHRKKETSTVYHLPGDNQLYVVGGEQKNASDAGYCFTQVRSLDMDNLKTSVVGHLQKARRNPGVIKVEGKLYVYCGTNNKGQMHHSIEMHSLETPGSDFEKLEVKGAAVFKDSKSFLSIQLKEEVLIFGNQYHKGVISWNVQNNQLSWLGSVLETVDKFEDANAIFKRKDDLYIMGSNHI